MDGVDPKAASYAITQVTDGTVFETFGLGFLSTLLGYQFVPIGGIKDRGIDGLEHTFNKADNPKTIYQLSVQKDYKGKIVDSLEKLLRNKIPFQQFVYVTNRLVLSCNDARYMLGSWHGKSVRDSSCGRRTEAVGVLGA